MITAPTKVAVPSRLHHASGGVTTMTSWWCWDPASPHEVAWSLRSHAPDIHLAAAQLLAGITAEARTDQVMVRPGAGLVWMQLRGSTPRLYSFPTDRLRSFADLVRSQQAKAEADWDAAAAKELTS